MKKIYFLLMTLLVAATGWSQKTTSWTGGVNSNWTIAGNWDNGLPVANDIVVFPTGVSQAIVNVPTITLQGLHIEGNSEITLENTTVGTNRIITVSNGAAVNDFTIEAGSRLTMGTNINITMGAGASGNPTRSAIDGELIVNPSRVFTSNNPNSLSTVTGLIQNSGSVVGATSRLSFAAGGTYIHALNGGVIPRATWAPTSTASIEGITSTGPSNLNQAFGNFTWNSPLQTIHFSFGAALTTINGNFTVISTGTNRSIRLKNIEPGTTSTTVAGDYIQTGGILYVVGSNNSHNLNIKRGFNMSGGSMRRGGTANASSIANVIFSGTAVQTFARTGGNFAGAINFIINNNAKVDFGTSLLTQSSGTFTLSAGGKIITSHNNGLGNFGSIRIARVYNSGADYEFRGITTGVFTTTTPNTVRDLIINNTVNGGDVDLAMPMTVTRNLILTEGMITTTNNLLTVAAAGSATAPTSTSFVNGPLAKVGNTNFTFPVGKEGDGYRTIGISSLSGNATFVAEFFRSNPGAATLGAGLTQISACEYWDLARPAGTASAQVTLSWEPGSPCGSSGVYVTNPVTLRVAHLVGTTWINEGNSARTGNNTAGTVTSNAVSAFSPFTLAGSNAENPLPVIFANVKAYEKNNGVQIEWSNLTEKDVASYSVERSTNGADYSSIAQQLPTSNQNDKVDYSAFDANPAQGTNYYRIKAVETTGKIVYSKVLTVSLGSANKGLKVYPNPVRGNQVTISLSNIKRGQYTLRVINTAGQDIHRQVLNNQGSTLTQTIDLPSIKAGVYNILIIGSDYRETKTFVVQ